MSHLISHKPDLGTTPLLSKTKQTKKKKQKVPSTHHRGKETARQRTYQPAKQPVNKGGSQRINRLINKLTKKRHKHLRQHYHHSRIKNGKIVLFKRQSLK
jgi:hypothetical protein